MNAIDRKAAGGQPAAGVAKAIWGRISRWPFYSLLIEVAIVGTAAGIVGAQLAQWWRP